MPWMKMGISRCLCSIQWKMFMWQKNVYVAEITYINVTCSCLVRVMWMNGFFLYFFLVHVDAEYMFSRWSCYLIGWYQTATASSSQLALLCTLLVQIFMSGIKTWYSHPLIWPPSHSSHTHTHTHTHTHAWTCTHTHTHTPELCCGFPIRRERSISHRGVVFSLPAIKDGPPSVP